MNAVEGRKMASVIFNNCDTKSALHVQEGAFTMLVGGKPERQERDEVTLEKKFLKILY